MNEYGTMHPTRKERRKHVLWIQMKIFATEKLLLVSAAVTFFIFLFEVVIEASRGIRWEKESFCCSFYSRTKTNFHFSIFDSDCQIVIRQKNVGICKSSQIRLIIAPLLNVFQSLMNTGSGGGYVGRAVASDSRDPRFKSCHRNFFIYQSNYRKDKIKNKSLGLAHL